MSDQEKTEQPTPRKLKKSRDKGQVFKSSDVTQTVVFIALVGMAVLGLRMWLPMLHDEMRAWPARMMALAHAGPELALATLLDATASALKAAAWPVGVLFLVACVFGLLGAGLQVRGVFSGDPLVPKAERLNPGANLKRWFSTRNAYDVVKILLKVTLLCAAVYLSVKAAFPDWLAFMRNGGGPEHSGVMLGRTLLSVALICIAVYILTSAIDYGHQYYEYIKEQRMSKDELRREFKEIEGDPYIKGYRRAIMREMATTAPEGDLKGARVVVTNPTHFAVALAYDPAAGGLPSVVAKGVDRAALAIRQQAQRLGLPIVENRLLARKLHAQVPVGQFITNDTMADVARLLAQVSLPRAPGAGADARGRTRVGVPRS